MAASIAQYLTEGQQAGARYCLAAPRRAPQGTAGSQLGRLAGESMEFMDHREYQPGDDLRRLDWAAYARSDKMIVKLYRQEVCPHLDVVIDGSRSMALHGTQKLRAAVGLAAALGTAAGNAGPYASGLSDRAGLPAGRQRRRAADALAGPGVRLAGEPARVVAHLPPAWRPRGIRVLISDLLWLGDPLELLTGLSDRAAAVYVIQVLAAADVRRPQRGNVRLVDSETEQRRGDVSRRDRPGPLPQQSPAAPRELAPGRPAGRRRVRAAGGRGALPRLGLFAAGGGGHSAHGVS